MPEIVAIHHVKLPVSNVTASRDWYSEVLGFTPVMDFEEENELVGVELVSPSGVSLGLHLAPERAQALEGFDPVALTVADRAELVTWAARLDDLGVEHSDIRSSHLGWSLYLSDPDGIRVALHTREHPSADDT